MKIAGREIGEGHSPWLVAEMSANHNGSIDRALRLIEAAKECGAEAIKLQLYDPDKLAKARGGPDKVLKSGPWSGRKLIDIYKQGATPREWFPKLFEFANKAGITLFSSVFHAEDVEFLVKLGCPALKIASFEIRNTALIRKAVATGKPVIISTGMSSDDEIDEAATHISGNGALLHCVSAYPCPVESASLRQIRRLKRYGVAGYSDHTLGTDTAIAAVALGASIIEKHLTLSRLDGGLDSSFSAEPSELKRIADGTRNAWLAVKGKENKDVEGEYRGLRQVAA